MQLKLLFFKDLRFEENLKETDFVKVWLVISKLKGTFLKWEVVITPSSSPRSYQDKITEKS